MGWELTLRSPTGAFVKTVTHETPLNPIMAPIDVVLDAGGRTNSITLRARNDLLQAPPRAVIQYKAWNDQPITYQGRPVTFEGRRVKVQDNYEPLAAGVIVTSPPLTSPGSGPADRDADALDRITAEGLERLLRERIIGTSIWGDTDVATIAYMVCQAHAHPALVVAAKNFPATGHHLGVFYVPEKTLADALDGLIATLPNGGRWHVNSRREIVFLGGA